MPLPPLTATIATVVMTITVVIGAGISLFAHRAADRYDSRPLHLFSYGFAVITVGLLVGGFLVLLLGWSAVDSMFVQTTVFAFGFGLLARSLFVARGRTEPTLL